MRRQTCCRSLLPRLPGKSSSPIFVRCIAFLILLVSSAIFPASDAAQAVHATKSDVEAAYLYNFGKFVHWPEDAHLTTLNICILGHDPFGPSLDRIVAGERIDDHALTVTRLKDMSGIHACAMVFIAGSEAPRLTEEMSALAGSPVMTVSDMPGFMERGGMIQFVLVDTRVRFEVNLNAANKCGLTLSSQLLKAAVSVVGKPQAPVGKPQAVIEKPRAPETR